MLGNQAGFNHLPIEILFEIYSYLSPEQAAVVASVDKVSNKIIQGNLFWKKKYERYFPHLYDALTSQENINWYAEFRKTYADEYKDLSNDDRRLFSLVKEGDIESLKAKKIKLSDIDKQDKNGISLLGWAQRQDNQQLLNSFYQLVVASYTDSTGITVDVSKLDASKRTILHWAILCHQSESTVELLILQGAIVDELANSNNTPLITAAREGQAEIAELLIGRGANINARSSAGATALLFAIEKGHKNVVDVLLQHNADMSLTLQNGTDYHKPVVAGDTPLHAASKAGSPAMIRRLLKKNVDIESLNSQNQTPIDVALKDYQYSNELKLLDYSLKVNRRQDNHFKTSFTIFGHTFNFGYSAKQKKDAANALKEVVFNGANKSTLALYEKELNNGDLSSIYRSFQVR